MRIIGVAILGAALAGCGGRTESDSRRTAQPRSIPDAAVSSDSPGAYHPVPDADAAEAFDVGVDSVDALADTVADGLADAFAEGLVDSLADDAVGDALSDTGPIVAPSCVGRQRHAVFCHGQWLMSCDANGSPVLREQCASRDDCASAQNGRCTCPIPIEQIKPEIVKKGVPLFLATDVHHFAARIGSASDASPAVDLLSELYEGRHIASYQIPSWAPGMPHQPPYDVEHATSLAQYGIASTLTVPMCAFTSPGGMLFVATLVPADTGPPTAPSGRSADGVGPILPNNVLPIQAMATWTNSAGFSVTHSRWYQEAAWRFDSQADGYSHVVVTIALRVDGIPDQHRVPGQWKHVIEVTDRTGLHGWSITVPFTVL